MNNKPNRDELSRDGQERRNEGNRPGDEVWSPGQDVPTTSELDAEEDGDAQGEDEQTENEPPATPHPPLKGTDTPAHTGLLDADPEKGKRTTM